jgi:hypothetical protein
MEVNHNNNKTLHAHDGNEEMRFHKKNKVMECIIKVSIEKVPLIPPIYVFQPTYEGDEDGGIWMAKSQQHSNVIYKFQSPFIKYAFCTCE